MSQQKKQSFLHGAALLAMATAIVKVIGAFYKIPLNAIIGTKGFSYFNTAYDIYSVLMMISTAGLPVAMSRMISAANSLNNTRQMKRIYRTAQAIFLTLGLAGSLLMTVFARQLAAFQEQPDAWAAIAFLGPSTLLVCMNSAFRGFFQGQSNMIPTSVSQVIEAVFKLFVGLGAAYFLLKVMHSVPLAAGGAIAGVTIGCAAASIYLFSLFRRAYQSLEEGDLSQPVRSYGSTARELLTIAIPITIGSAGLQIITMMEIKVYMSQILGSGFTQDAADQMKGIYNMAQTLFNMPCAFIVPITISAIPSITNFLTLKNFTQVRATEESACRITALISMPCAIGLAVLSQPVMGLLGGYSGQELVLGGILMSILGICIIFNSTVMLSNAIMQAHGHVNLPVINMFIGGFLKLGLIYFLSADPRINIIGAPLGTLLCYSVITVLNLFAMRRIFEKPPRVLRNMARPLLAALLMGGAVLGVYTLLLGRFSLESKLGLLVLTALPILVGVVVYVICAVGLKAITAEDCALLPKGERIAHVLRLDR